MELDSHTWILVEYFRAAIPILRFDRSDYEFHPIIYDCANGRLLQTVSSCRPIP